MRIENHRLVSATPDFRPEYSPDEQGGPLPKEGLIAVIHYSVTETAEATKRVLDYRDFVSCHLTIDKTGRIIQMVPFDRVAFHCGGSEYMGRRDCNKFSLGIEVSNPGPLLKMPDGSYQTTYKKPWTGNVVEAWHPNDESQRGWRYWAEYSQTELDLCAHIVTLWKLEYGLVDVVGHDEIAVPVGRKSDPGPAYPIDWLRKVVFPERDTDRAPPPQSAA